MVRQEGGAQARSSSRSSPTPTRRFRPCAVARSTRSPRRPSPPCRRSCIRRTWCTALSRASPRSTGTSRSAGAGALPLLKKLCIRQAIAMGMNRPSLIKALYGGIAPGLKPLNNPFYEFGAPASGKYAYFKKYNFNPKKAIALLKKHGCTGGPSSPSSSNNKVWTCGGQKTEFHFDTTTQGIACPEQPDLQAAADGDRHQARRGHPRCRPTSSARSCRPPTSTSASTRGSAARIRPDSTPSTSATTPRRTSAGRTTRATATRRSTR